MPLATAHGIVLVAPDAVACVPVDHNQTYAISPEVDKDNVRMGMIGVPEGFPTTNRSYYHEEFNTGSGPFNFQPQVNGTNLSTLYFYLLLPWSGTATGANATTYTIGLNDGADGQLSQNKVASISITHIANQTAPSFEDTPAPHDCHQLPATPIEFADNCYVSVQPLAGDGGGHGESRGDNLDWVNIGVQRENGHPTLEANTRIHVISGRSGEQIEGIIQPTEHSGLTHSVQLGPLDTANNNINLFALVAPTTNPPGSNDFTFEVGDPEKDGKVSIRTV